MVGLRVGNGGLLWLSLLVTLAAPACGSGEERGGERDRKLPFYKGRAVEPVRSSSRVETPDRRHVLEPVLQGDVVRHDFIVENRGDEVLELRDARCRGCIVESYARRIQPGLTGRIATRILTDSRGGQEIAGTLRAATNDETRPEIAIDFSVFVRAFAHVSPYRVWLEGPVGGEIVETCTVFPAEEHPFSITGIRARKGVWFRWEYAEIEKDGRRGYEIVLTNTRTKPGPYQDVLFVQTDSDVRPEFKIRIEGRIGD